MTKTARLSPDFRENNKEIPSTEINVTPGQNMRPGFSIYFY